MLPKIGELVTFEGKTGRVSELNILKRSYKFRTEEQEEVEVVVDVNGSN